MLAFDEFTKAARAEENSEKIKSFGSLMCKIVFSNGFVLLENEKLTTAIKLAKNLDLSPVPEKSWNRKLNVNISEENAAEKITEACQNILKVTVAKQKSKEYGFICLFTDGKGTFWNKVSRGLPTAINESLASLETLADAENVFTEEQKQKINRIYGILNSLSK